MPLRSTAGGGGVDVTLLRIVSVGSSSTSHPIARGLYYAKDNSLIVQAGRSYMVSVYDRATCAFDSHTNYDVYDDSANATTMANALNALDSTKIVIIHAFDEPSSNRLSGGLPDAMYRCGASPEVFGYPSFKSRSSYILVGIPDIGEGNGLELYSGDEDNDTDAWCETTLLIKNGNPMLTGHAKNQVLRLGGARDDQEYSGFILTTQIAGESLSFGELVYRASDNRLNKADADTLSKTEGDLAIVLTTGATAENGYVTILKLGSIKNTSWSFTIGAILYVSQTAGVITATEPSALGTFSRKIGYAQAANIVYFDPSHTILENG